MGDIKASKIVRMERTFWRDNMHLIKGCHNSMKVSNLKVLHPSRILSMRYAFALSLFYITGTTKFRIENKRQSHINYPKTRVRIHTLKEYTIWRKD